MDPDRAVDPIVGNPYGSCLPRTPSREDGFRSPQIASPLPYMEEAVGPSASTSKLLERLWSTNTKVKVVAPPGTARQPLCVGTGVWRADPVPLQPRTAKQMLLADMLWDDSFTDCVVLVDSARPSEARIKKRANRTLLARCSDVLDEILFSQARPARNDLTSAEFELAGCSEAAFRELQRCAYDIEPVIEDKNFVEVFRFSKKYMVDELSEAVLAFLDTAASSATFSLRVLDAALVAGAETDDELAPRLHACLSAAVQYGETLLESGALLTCAQATILTILQHEKFNCLEENLWHMLIQWQETRPPGALRQIVPYLRFNTMSPNFFVDTVVPSGVLEAKEVVELLSARTTGRPAPRFPQANVPRCLQLPNDAEDRLSEEDRPRPGDSPGGSSPLSTPRLPESVPVAAATLLPPNMSHAAAAASRGAMGSRRGPSGRKTPQAYPTARR
eukprot:TRINITY_DN74767_c0_g1_i1.p1 TRINITY_DN74767_c0_g1~~TRINITY_DN74767_c0_g1_i1.p1  ORF type:complete len:447 (-),score=55.35 TRINITY_DN74767_c0_g1_i1:29-1369(-)